MKKQTILPVLLAAILIACNGDETKSFIEGTYADSAESKYSIVNDTLVIEAAENNNFLIHRKTGIRLISEGKLGKLQYETEEWDAVYNEKNKTLTETRNGKVISFFPEAQKLTVERREYQKLD